MWLLLSVPPPPPKKVTDMYFNVLGFAIVSLFIIYKELFCSAAFVTCHAEQTAAVSLGALPPTNVLASPGIRSCNDPSSSTSQVGDLSVSLRSNSG